MKDPILLALEKILEKIQEVIEENEGLDGISTLWAIEFYIKEQMETFD